MVEETRYVDLFNRYLQILIDFGLPEQKNFKPKEVLIVGAGIAGLTAGSLLKAAGHRVTSSEANADRIGGRIKTFHKNPFNPEKPAPFKDSGQYAEAGAMRLPSLGADLHGHHRVMETAEGKDGSVPHLVQDLRGGLLVFTRLTGKRLHFFPDTWAVFQS